VTKPRPPWPWLVAGLAVGGFAGAVVLTAFLGEDVSQRAFLPVAFVFCAAVVMPALFLPIWLLTKAVRTKYFGAMLCGSVSFFIAMMTLGLTIGTLGDPSTWIASELLVDSLWIGGAGAIAGLVFWVVAYSRRSGDQAL
jgi:hypothetical protein